MSLSLLVIHLVHYHVIAILTVLSLYIHMCVCMCVYSIIMLANPPARQRL